MKNLPGGSENCVDTGQAARDKDRRSKRLVELHYGTVYAAKIRVNFTSTLKDFSISFFLDIHLSRKQAPRQVHPARKTSSSTERGHMMPLDGSFRMKTLRDYVTSEFVIVVENCLQINT